MFDSDDIDSDCSFIPGNVDESECPSVTVGKFLRADESSSGAESPTFDNSDIDMHVLCDDSEVDIENGTVKKRGAVRENEILRDVEYPDIYICKNLNKLKSLSAQAYKKKNK